MSEPLVAKCGATKSKRGRAFTEGSLADHQASCPKCLGLDKPRRSKRSETAESLGLGMTDLLAGDESDGVFWGMAAELGEWL